MFIRGGVCYPMGVVTRSGLLALFGTPSGMIQLVQGDIAIANGDFGSGFEQVERSVADGNRIRCDC